MCIRSRAAGLLAWALLAGAGATGARGAEWTTRVLVAASLDEAQAWIDQPARRRDDEAGKLRRVAAGRKIFFPILASGALAGSEVRLEADIAFFAPDGRVIWESKRCCTAVLSGPRAVALTPAASIVLEPGDPQGLYTVRATVTDGARRQLMKETFSYVGTNAASR
jgi:hypothetical protein